MCCPKESSLMLLYFIKDYNECYEHKILERKTEVFKKNMLNITVRELMLHLQFSWVFKEFDEVKQKYRNQFSDSFNFNI